MSPVMIMVAGMLIFGGVAVIAAALAPAAPRLQSALDHLAGESEAAVGPVQATPGSRSERLGVLAYQRSPIPLTPRQRQLLRMQDKSIAEFYADKIVMAVIGAVLPALVGFGWGLLTGRVAWWPVGLAPIGLVAGYLVPDLLLRRSGSATQSRAVESLLVYIDLVTLERLANASATEALHSAAALSDVPLFAHIRTALERARLEQQSPYGELRRLAEELDLPELKDVADVMQLDESGAALSGTLRARVRELRNAHLTREQIAAGAAAEGMTIFMTIPALIFGMIFLGAAMLTLLNGA